MTNFGRPEFSYITQNGFLHEFGGIFEIFFESMAGPTQKIRVCKQTTTNWRDYIGPYGIRVTKTAPKGSWLPFRIL